MPLPKALARFNRKVTNPVLRHVAGRLPGFAILIHVGRRSGTVRSNPVNLFRHGDRYAIALTYGRDAQWVKNVLAAGGCEVLTVSRRIALTAPRIVQDESLVPAPVRPILRAVRVSDFLVLERAT
jgi:deazaflavin-dependent oxidoreductase (nitroreductase family)